MGKRKRTRSSSTPQRALAEGRAKPKKELMCDNRACDLPRHDCLFRTKQDDELPEGMCWSAWFFRQPETVKNKVRANPRTIRQYFFVQAELLMQGKRDDALEQLERHKQ